MMRYIIFGFFIIFVSLTLTNGKKCPASSTSTAKTALLEGCRELSLTLWGNLSSSTTTGNEFMSPISICLALTSLFFGAEGQSAIDLAKTLGLSATANKATLSSELNRIMIGCSEKPPTKEGSTTLRLSNRLYVQKNTTLCPGIAGFLTGSGNQDNQVVQQLDFASGPIAALKLINTWIKEQTNGKIVDLLKTGDVTALSKLVLANAAYFFGRWLHEFGDPTTKKFNTRPQNPESPANMVDVPMLQIKENFRHVQSTKLQSHIVEIPFLGDCYSFYVVLPIKPETKVSAVVTLLTMGGAKVLRQELDSMQELTINLTIPEFRIEQEIELTPPLTTMGLGGLFKAETAELSGFNGEDGLYVSKIRHQAVVAVKKDGVEAAAATAVVVSSKSLKILPDAALVLLFNRPFLFFIRDKWMDLIIFAGVLRNPK